MSIEAESSLLQRARGIVAKPEFFLIFAIVFAMGFIGFFTLGLSGLIVGEDQRHNVVVNGVKPMVYLVEILLLGVGIGLQFAKEFGGKAMLITLAIVAALTMVAAVWVEALPTDARGAFSFGFGFAPSAGADDGGWHLLIAFAFLGLIALGWAARNVLVIVVAAFAAILGLLAISMAVMSLAHAGEGNPNPGPLVVLSMNFRHGGFGMWPILFWQLVAVVIIIERAIYLFRSSVRRDVFVSVMHKCIGSGDVARAIKLCAATNAPLARIVKAGLMKIHRPDSEVQAAMDEAALRELPRIEHRTGYLALMANLAMLSGLFGTVVGLILAFGAVANADASSRATMLARGISEAMNCTAFGLLAAIMTLIGFAVLNGRTQSLLDDINGATVEVMEMVMANRSKLSLQGTQAA